MCVSRQRQMHHPPPSSTPSPSSTPKEKDESSGINTDTLIGIIVGAAAGSILIFTGGYWLYKKLTNISSNRVFHFDAK